MEIKYMKWGCNTQKDRWRRRLHVFVPKQKKHEEDVNFRRTRPEHVTMKQMSQNGNASALEGFSEFPGISNHSKGLSSYKWHQPQLNSKQICILLFTVHVLVHGIPIPCQCILIRTTHRLHPQTLLIQRTKMYLCISTK